MKQVEHHPIRSMCPHPSLLPFLSPRQNHESPSQPSATWGNGKRLGETTSGSWHGQQSPFRSSQHPPTTTIPSGRRPTTNATKREKNVGLVHTPDATWLIISPKNAIVRPLCDPKTKKRFLMRWRRPLMRARERHTSCSPFPKDFPNDVARQTCLNL